MAMLGWHEPRARARRIRARSRARGQSNRQWRELDTRRQSVRLRSLPPRGLGREAPLPRARPIESATGAGRSGGPRNADAGALPRVPTPRGEARVPGERRRRAPSSLEVHAGSVLTTGSVRSGTRQLAGAVTCGETRVTAPAPTLAAAGCRRRARGPPSPRSGPGLAAGAPRAAGEL